MDPLTYFSENFEYFKGELAKLISFKTISTLPEFRPEIDKGAKWLTAKFESMGFSVKVVETKSNPVLIAQRIEDASLPTILIYGHFDVQPVEPISDWETDPFKLTEKNGKMYGRGIMDNKGQFMMHVSAVDALIKSEGKLPVNIKFILESDEETGSPYMQDVFKDNKGVLAADAFIVTDGTIVGSETPLIEVSFKGVVNCELTIYGPKEDLHSGQYGGVIANPAYEMSSLIAKFYDQNYSITIPHFYDSVEDISPEDKGILVGKKTTDEEYLAVLGAPKILGEKGYTKYELAGLRPTLQIIGIASGYAGRVGFKNIIPASANAKFNFRIVPNQDPVDVYNMFVQFVADNISNGVRYEISRLEHYAEPTKIDITNEYMKKARTILTEVFDGNAPELEYVGGTLPIIGYVNKYLNIPVLAIPLSQEDCGMHAPNERLYVKNFKKGVQFSITFLKELGK